VDVGDYVASGVSTDRVLKVEKFPYNVGTSNQRRGAIFSNIAGGIRRRIDSAKKVLFVHTKNASDGNVTQQMQRQTQWKQTTLHRLSIELTRSGVTGCCFTGVGDFVSDKQYSNHQNTEGDRGPMEGKCSLHRQAPKFM